MKKKSIIMATLVLAISPVLAFAQHDTTPPVRTRTEPVHDRTPPAHDRTPTAPR
jgi:hypothetical protein